MLLEEFLDLDIGKKFKVNIKKTMCHPHLKVWVCDRHLFLGCSEIKAPIKYPLTKVSGLISDIIKFPYPK